MPSSKGLLHSLIVRRISTQISTFLQPYVRRTYIELVRCDSFKIAFSLIDPSNLILFCPRRQSRLSIRLNDDIKKVKR